MNKRHDPGPRDVVKMISQKAIESLAFIIDGDEQMKFY